MHYNKPIMERTGDLQPSATPRVLHLHLHGAVIGKRLDSRPVQALEGALDLQSRTPRVSGFVRVRYQSI